MIALLLVVTLVLPSLAQNVPQQALLAVKEANAQDMIHSLKRLPKGARIALWLTHGRKLEGAYVRYMPYDRSVWLKQDGRLLAEAYDISEVQDVRVVVHRPV